LEIIFQNHLSSIENKKLKMKGLKVDAIVSWEEGIIIVVIGIVSMFMGNSQSKKKGSDIDKVQVTKPTTKILFGSMLNLIGLIQLFSLLKG
tara:strand:+ start:281 stop:553 length:273 start_codon:yes stop_codon:yes gene_type:complete